MFDLINCLGFLGFLSFSLLVQYCYTMLTLTTQSQTPHIKGHSPNKNALTSEDSHSSGAPKPLYFSPTGYKFKAFP